VKREEKCVALGGPPNSAISNPHSEIGSVRNPLESSQVANKTKLILLVDDEQAVVQALAKRCQTLGVSVRKAESAVAAMLIINQEQEAPDLMLLDYSMPGADGLALCDMVRTDPALKDVPVILLTGHDSAELRRRCEQAGAHYVRKDVDAWKNLQPLIRRLLGLEPSAEQDRGGVASGGAEAPSTQTPPAPPQTKKILIIDDDPHDFQRPAGPLAGLGLSSFRRPHRHGRLSAGRSGNAGSHCAGL